ncbi:hypothetical protein F5B22DRAFT_424891 [Xylaria bambusicola]|uniref:uncharacterized protein n=1 Tax=Xylaria bambusicola TaxID=326684 RepID=UPI0020086827|nr:uncharacterized protein F5B22DRAFT_424891 [Xylaria bambusicola]KAI0508283.1 hypothetical protein F5B22DRAFT_424891 [Xylaria bambusicola]
MRLSTTSGLTLIDYILEAETFCTRKLRRVVLILALVVYMPGWKLTSETYIPCSVVASHRNRTLGLNCHAVRSAELQDQLISGRSAPQDLSTGCIQNWMYDESLYHVDTRTHSRASCHRGGCRLTSIDPSG